MSCKKAKASPCLIFSLLLACATPVRAADWGPRVQEIFKHLATHMAAHQAQEVINRLTQGEKMPVLQLSDARLKQMLDDKLADCVRRAQEIDDQDPQQRAMLGKPPVLIGPAYAEQKAIFKDRCGSIFPDRVN